MFDFAVTALQFLLLLTALIMLHEAGHFFSARALGAKVLEFGWGFPPRALGLYTGRTPVVLHPEAVFENVSGREQLRPGMLVRVHSLVGDDDVLQAHVIETPDRSGKLPPATAPAPGQQDGMLVHEGKIRAIDGDRMLLADMLYSVNWLPLGGFVRMAGENNHRIPLSLAAKSIPARLTVLAAGSVINLALPVLLFMFLFAIPEERYEGRVQITSVNDGSPAQLAGMQGGDVILEADGHAVYDTESLRYRILLNLGQETEFLVMRPERLVTGGLGLGSDAGPVDGAVRDTPPFSVNAAPRWDPPDGEGNLGVQIRTVDGQIVARSSPLWRAVPDGFVRAWEMGVLFRNEIASWFLDDRGPEVLGPVGIAQVTGEAVDAGWRPLVFFAALLSLNLGVVNLLPLPALDGGRIVFVLLEWVRGGRRIPPEREGVVHALGFSLLLGVIAVVTLLDVTRILQGGSVLD